MGKIEHPFVCRAGCIFFYLNTFLCPFSCWIDYYYYSVSITIINFSELFLYWRNKAFVNNKSFSFFQFDFFVFFLLLTVVFCNTEFLFYIVKTLIFSFMVWFLWPTWKDLSYPRIHFRKILCFLLKGENRDCSTHRSWYRFGVTQRGSAADCSQPQAPAAAAAAAMSLQSCPTPCDPIDGSPPGSTVPGILQARTLEWVAISFSKRREQTLGKALQSRDPLSHGVGAGTLFVEI